MSGLKNSKGWDRMYNLLIQKYYHLSLPRIEQEKRNESVPKLVISTREQGSQVEEEIPEPLRKFVVEMVEERMKLPSMAREIQTEEKEETRMGK